MKNKLHLSTILFLFISIQLNAQDNCSKPCLGKEKWKSERIVIDNKTNKASPFSSIIKITTTKWYNNGFYGTASFINENTIITAHHNISRKTHITNIKYTLEGKNIELKRKDFKIHYLKRKLKSKSDIAIIKIINHDKIHPIKTKFEIIDNILADTESEIHLTGFPCDYDGKEKVDKKTKKSELKIDSGKTLIGYPLFTCTGDSGAPLWFFYNGKHYLIGIHHGGNEGNIEYQNTDYNVSVYFNKNIVQWINEIAN